MKLKIVSIRLDTWMIERYGGEWWLGEIQLKNGSRILVHEFRSKPTLAQVAREYYLGRFGKSRSIFD